MSFDYEFVRLGDLISLQSGNTPSKKENTYWNGTHNWASAKDLKSFYITETIEKLTPTGLNKSSRVISEGATLILTRGMTLLKDVPIAVVKNDTAFNQDLKAVIPKRPDIFPDFIPYLLLGNKKRIHELVDLAGHGTGRLATDSLLNLEVQLPPERERQKLACFFRAIDDKLELNENSNQTLEQMAQAIFKSWFVDFEPVKAKMAALAAGGSEQEALLAAMQAISGKDAEQLAQMAGQQPQQYAELRATAELFPAALQDSELGAIPEGWEVSSIYDIADVLYGAPFKSKQFNDTGAGLPLIRIRDLKNEHPGVSTEEQHPKGYLVQDGDLLVGMDGEFKPYVWGGGKAWMNQRVCCFKPQKGLSVGLVKGFIEPQLQQLELTATATTVIHLGKGDINKFKFINAGDSLLRLYSSISESLFEQIVSNKRQSLTLTELRDTLLPKLLSGELTLPDTEPAEAALAELAHG